MNKWILLSLTTLLLSGCVTESVRIVPKKIGVNAGITFNPCGSDVQGYDFSPTGSISITCTNGTIYSVRNQQELNKMKNEVMLCQQQGISDYSQCLTIRAKQAQQASTSTSNKI